MERGRVTAAVGRVTAWLARMVHDEAVRWAFGVFLAVRVCLSALAIVVIVLRPLPEGAHERYVMSLGLEPVPSRAGQLLLEVWQRWDVVHYQRIAAYGYTDDESTAFYPLVPSASEAGRWYPPSGLPPFGDTDLQCGFCDGSDWPLQAD